MKWIVLDYTDNSIAVAEREPAIVDGCLLIYKGGLLDAIFAPGEWKMVYRDDE